MELFCDGSNGPALNFLRAVFGVLGDGGMMIMERIVMKFGGTSVANPEKIAQAAKRVAQEVRQGKQSPSSFRQWEKRRMSYLRLLRK